MGSKLFLAAALAVGLFTGPMLGAAGLPVPPGRLYAVITRAGDLPKGQGHVQGICASSNAVYMSILRGIHKFDWNGRRIASVDCPDGHVGDICIWKGRLYVANCGGNNAISVYDEDLGFVRREALPRGADGIACIDGVLYVGLGAVSDPTKPFRGNWFGKYDAETLKPLCEPFKVDHGFGSWLGVQNIATDGCSLYVGFYTPDEDTPNFIKFDRNFRRLGAWRLGVGHGIDVVGGGRDGALRFVHAWTLTGPEKQPQVLLRFAELRGESLSDVTKYETSAYEPLRERTVLDDLMPRPVKTEIVRYPHSKLAKDKLKNVTVVTAAVPGAPSATADEAYVLEIGGAGVTIAASGSRGERWARRTLRMLARLSPTDSVPCCRITDWPQLKWRGFMLDTVRNYLPVADLKDVLDAMSLYKLNLFHWHLTENYAWRLESKRYPQLQSDAAFVLRHRGKFYTQDEFRDIVAHAASRGITVMPEFDVPGHAFAFRKAFGFKTMKDPGVAEKVADLLRELCSLVPKRDMPFVHIGTDEVYRRDIEGATPEALSLWAKTVADEGRTVVSWTPGEKFVAPGPRVDMLWTREATVTDAPYFDAYGMYIEDLDPFELLPCATYWGSGTRFAKSGNTCLGAIFCAWHDGFVGEKYENLLRNQQVLPSCALFGEAFWSGREHHLPQYRTRLPLADDERLRVAEDVERRMIAQRDRIFAASRHPFHFLRQTDMRWRLSYADGRIVARNIAQATITPFRTGNLQENFVSLSNGTVVAETWIRSPVDQSVGAWIGFTSITRDHGLVYAAPLPGVGEWNRFGAKAELNGEPIAPPAWKRPGLGLGKPVEGAWNEIWTLYEADEEPFTDQEYFMREPTQITLKAGWNHVKLTIPHPGREKGSKQRPRWVATFIPLLGTTDHPHEVPGLEYSCDPPM